MRARVWMGLKRMDWKWRALLSILIGVVAVITLLFGVTYFYFVRKLETVNEKIVRMAFVQSEKDLGGLLKKAEEYLNVFYNDEIMWQFAEGVFRNEIERSTVSMKIVSSFDERLLLDNGVYGFAILSGEGRLVSSSSSSRSRTGIQAASQESLEGLLRKARDSYPYVVWAGSRDLTVTEGDSLHILCNRPVLLGIKAMEDIRQSEDASYLLVALDEKTVREQYEIAIYNGSRALLADQANVILSDTDERKGEAVYRPDPACQNIEYELSYMGWKLVNSIPRKDYLKEARRIRSFGIGVGLLACGMVVLISLVWSKRYIRPIQSLMEGMEAVGKDRFDLPKPTRKGWAELDQLNQQFYGMVQKLKNHMEQLKVAEQEKAKEELLALQYQINPHFLCNSLNSIRWMATMTNNTAVADSLVILSRIITPICRDPSFTWKLKDELDFLENYVHMMNIRYVDMVEYVVECPEELYGEEFPRFILQPLVENCFKHGGGRRNFIWLSVSKKDTIYVELRNSGVYMTQEKLEELNHMLRNGVDGSEHMGLLNIRKRLRLLYGEEGKMWMESGEDGSFTVYICF